MSGPRSPTCCRWCSNAATCRPRSEEHTSELQSQSNLVCRLLLEKKKKTQTSTQPDSFTPKSPTKTPTHHRVNTHTYLRRLTGIDYIRTLHALLNIIIHQVCYDS